jgi:hypothetical protein
MELGAGQPPPGDQFDEVTIELSPAEAAAGAVRGVTVAPGGHTVTVQLPAGMADGAVVRLPGAGRPDPAGGAPRDLVLRVRVTAAPGPAPAPVSGPAPPATPGASRRRAKIISVTAIGLAVVVLAGCCGLSRLVLGGGDDADARPAAGTSRGAGTSAPPVVEPATAEEYQQTLAAVDKSLAIAVATLAAAKTPARAQSAAAALATAAESASGQLSSTTPPEPVADAHQSLITAMDDLASAASETDAAAGDRQVCTGSSATALFSRNGAVDGVRSAAQALATADPAHTYRVGSFLPRKTEDGNRRMRNGAYVKRTGGGSGHLKIDNGAAGDAVISLVKSGSKRPATTVYVRGKGKHTVTGVRDGTYRIYMASGADWDAKAKRFTRNCGFSQFDDPFKFTTTSSQYTVWEVTLTPVAGGNASTSGVDPDAFPVS